MARSGRTGVLDIDVRDTVAHMLRTADMLLTLSAEDEGNDSGVVIPALVEGWAHNYSLLDGARDLMDEFKEELGDHFYLLRDQLDALYTRITNTKENAR